MILERVSSRALLLWCLILAAASFSYFLVEGQRDTLTSADTLRLHAAEGPGAIGRYTQYAPAPDHIETPERLNSTSMPWQQGTTDGINLGYTAKRYWFRSHWITDQLSTGHWILEITNSQIDSAKVFLYQNQQLIQQWHIGDGQPFAQRPIDHPFFVLPITLESQSDYELYLLIDNSEAMELPLKLMSQQQFTHFNMLRAWVDGIFNGFLIIMAAYSLALFAILKDKTYLFYVSYIVSMLLFFLFQQGMLYPLLFPESPRLQHHIITFISLYIFLSIALFFRTLLDLPQQLPRQWWIYKALLTLHGTFCLLFFVFDYQIMMKIMIVNTLMATIVAMISILQLALKGSQSAQIVIVGWALLLFFLIFFSAAKTGFIYNEFMATYGLRIGISFEILIFSFALSFRINQEREAKEQALQQANLERSQKLQAQELALQREIEANVVKEEALRIEIQHREELQRLVEERTADLARTLTELEKSNKELELLSCKDGLTALYNRRAFDLKLAEYWKLAQRNNHALSLLIIDIDHFKQINDRRGHLCGDYVLKAFAALLTQILQRPTDIITRYGGEEFAILLSETPLGGAETIADNIVRQAAAYEFQWEGERFHISVSIGVETRSSHRLLDSNQLLANADTALYQAKNEGRNRWVSANEANH